MNRIYTLKISWGWLIYLTTFIVLILNLITLYYVFLAGIRILFLLLPLVILDLIFLPVIRKPRFILFDTGVRIKGTFLSWKEIKSISFQSGRINQENPLKGRLPAIQRIFILDKKGREFSTLIDIDYFSKQDRKNNNLMKLNKYLFDMNKVSIISDWAEKR